MPNGSELPLLPGQADTPPLRESKSNAGQRQNQQQHSHRLFQKSSSKEPQVDYETLISTFESWLKREKIVKLNGENTGVALQPRTGITSYFWLKGSRGRLVKDACLTVASIGTAWLTMIGQDENGDNDWGHQFTPTLMVALAELGLGIWENVVEPREEIGQQRELLRANTAELREDEINAVLERIQEVLGGNPYLLRTARDQLFRSKQALISYKNRFTVDRRSLDYMQRAVYSSGVLEVIAVPFMFFKGLWPIVSSGCSIAAISACVGTAWHANTTESSRSRRIEIRHAKYHLQSLELILKNMDDINEMVKSLNALIDLHSKLNKAVEKVRQETKSLAGDVGNISSQHPIKRDENDQATNAGNMVAFVETLEKMGYSLKQLNLKKTDSLSIYAMEAICDLVRVLTREKETLAGLQENHDQEVGIIAGMISQAGCTTLEGYLSNKEHDIGRAIQKLNHDLSNANVPSLEVKESKGNSR